MRVINLFGGPGVGKSTTAAGLFAKLKLSGRRAELVTEFAKDLVYEQSHHVLGDSLHVLAQQFHRQWRLAGQGVDYVITDSPLLLNPVYAQGLFRAPWYEALAWDVWRQFDNECVLLNRVKPYAEYGRLQDEAGAREVDGRSPASSSGTRNCAC